MFRRRRRRTWNLRYKINHSLYVKISGEIHLKCFKKISKILTDYENTGRTSGEWVDLILRNTYSKHLQKIFLLIINHSTANKTDEIVVKLVFSSLRFFTLVINFPTQTSKFIFLLDFDSSSPLNFLHKLRRYKVNQWDY